jgi:hypothetical protein
MTDNKLRELCKRHGATRYGLDELIQFPIFVAPYTSTPWHAEPSVQFVQMTLSTDVNMSANTSPHARVRAHPPTCPPYTYTSTPTHRHPQNTWNTPHPLPHTKNCEFISLLFYHPGQNAKRHAGFFFNLQLLT